MGFWKDLWDGIKLTAKTAFAVVEGGVKVALSAIGGFESGGPIGAAIAGFTSAIGNISSTASRIKHYMNEYEGKTDSQTVKNMAKFGNVVQGLSSIELGGMNAALASVESESPEVMKLLAKSAAKFYDGLNKTGSIQAAVKMAGGTPIAKHLAQTQSSAIAAEIAKRTGINPYISQALHNPITRAAQMLPTTSAYYPAMKDAVHGGGMEVAAMQQLRSGASSTPAQIVVGAG